jgi:hypothetical protein
MFANALALEHRHVIAAQAISDHATALQVMRKLFFGHSTMSSGDEGRVTIQSKSPPNAIDREQQGLAI